jgi:hypothetical protein
MPVLDGIAATEGIVQRHPGTAVVILSGQSDHEYLRRAMNVGASYYLNKPVSADELYNAVRRAFEVTALRRERFAQPPAAAAPAPGAAPRGEVAVAQRAILYEENQADPQNPRASAGRAVWRLDALNAGQGQPLETVVRVAIEVPDARLTLNMTFRRNLDQTLPASHTVELAFTTAPGDATRAVRDVGLLQLKAEEAVRGTPVAGLPVPVKDNVFLIGLSNLPGDIERNRELMLRRNWIDLPIRFASGQRAILSFEKGVSGDQVINDAFRQWGG